MANPIINDNELKRAIIMDHYQYARNHQLPQEGDSDYQKVHMSSDSCIDDIYVAAKIKDNVIEDVCFNGTACAICTSATSIMTELVKGKTIEQAQYIINEYYKMLDEKAYDDEVLQEAVVFCNTGKQANRIKCATIGWHGLEEIINGVNKHE